MQTVNRFRQRRGKILAGQIARLSDQLGRKLHILDVGGRAEYWKNVDTSRVASVALLNLDPGELAPGDNDGEVEFSYRVGNACDLGDYDDRSVDFVHSNSVIEHVGPWQQMAAMSSEMMRVSIGGWMQTPAWIFPIEPHFRAPFLHWFGQPVRRSLLSLSKPYRDLDVAGRRYHIDRINLLSRSEVEALFPGAEIYVERLGLPKSYVAWWNHHASMTAAEAS
jgi:hypothetical protein